MCVSSSSPSPLIVEFPSSPRQATTATTDNKSVHFEEYCQGIVFKVHPVNRSQLWYSSEDYSELLRQQVLESKMALTADSQDDTITDDKLSYCVGLEKALSPARARRIKDHQRQHANIIISSQAACTPEVLSWISMNSSKQARMRAHKLAVTYYSYAQER